MAFSLARAGEGSEEATDDDIERQIKQLERDMRLAQAKRAKAEAEAQASDAAAHAAEAEAKASDARATAALAAVREAEAEACRARASADPPGAPRSPGGPTTGGSFVGGSSTSIIFSSPASPALVDKEHVAAIINATAALPPSLDGIGPVVVDALELALRLGQQQQQRLGVASGEFLACLPSMSNLFQGSANAIVRRLVTAETLSLALAGADSGN